MRQVLEREREARRQLRLSGLREYGEIAIYL